MKIVRYFHSAAMAEKKQDRYFTWWDRSVRENHHDGSFKTRIGNESSDLCIKGMPMREEPLHLVPKHLRKEFEEILNVRIEGDLCPICRYRLKNEYNGEYERFPVETVDFSIRSRKGIGVVPPVDPNNQDTSVLIGSVDISKIDLYPEDDPEFFR